jgi:hypothetical protein
MKATMSSSSYSASLGFTRSCLEWKGAGGKFLKEELAEWCRRLLGEKGMGVK